MAVRSLTSIATTMPGTKHACDPDNSCALFLLHSIRLKKSRAVGGKAILFEPWRPRRANLTPISFTYRFN